MGREYTNTEVTKIWKPDTCAGSAKHSKEFRGVFNPTEYPQVSISAIDNEQITKQVDACSSETTCLYENTVANIRASTEDDKALEEEVKIEVIPNGPLKVEGKFRIKDKNGMEVKKEKAFLCRCGASSNRPYCDGTHKKINFQDS